MNAPRHSFTELRDRCVKHSVSVSKSVSTTATLARISILNSSILIGCDIENVSLAAKQMNYLTKGRGKKGQTPDMTKR